MVGWLVVMGLTTLWKSISVCIGPSPSERKKEERNDSWEKKMSKQPPPAPTANTVGPCPTIIQISRTPRHWKFTQHHRTTRPFHVLLELLLAGTNFHCPKPGRGIEVLLYVEERHWFWLVGCFELNGPLRRYFSLYRAVSQREGERGKKRIDESKNVQTTPIRTYYKRSRPLPYCNPNCRTPQH